jgi:hypothetical protein
MPGHQQQPVTAVPRFPVSDPGKSLVFDPCDQTERYHQKCLLQICNKRHAQIPKRYNSLLKGHTARKGELKKAMEGLSALYDVDLKLREDGNYVYTKKNKGASGPDDMCDDTGRDAAPGKGSGRL